MRLATRCHSLLSVVPPAHRHHRQYLDGFHGHAAHAQCELPLLRLSACTEGRNANIGVRFHDGFHGHAEQAQCELPLLRLSSRTDGRTAHNGARFHDRRP